MRHRRRRQSISNINVVPYLDVMLVLLVIFMITTPLFNQGVIDIPSVGNAPLPTAKGAQIEIFYDQTADNPYRVVDHKAGGSESAKLNAAELITELGKKRVLYGDMVIIISGDKTLSYEKVIALLGELRDAGYEKIALTAQMEGN